MNSVASVASVAKVAKRLNSSVSAKDNTQSRKNDEKVSGESKLPAPCGKIQVRVLAGQKLMDTSSESDPYCTIECGQVEKLVFIFFKD